MINIHDAIYAINSSVVTIRDNVAYDQENNVIEYDEKLAQAKLIELQAEAQAIESAKRATHESAIAKLKKIGLTDDEISALKGTL